MLETLQQLPSWKVVMRLIVVHASPHDGAKTGLFGLLGDARVQLVDVSDEARMNAYFDLAEECERKGHVHESQNLDIRQDLRPRVCGLNQEEIERYPHPDLRV